MSKPALIFVPGIWEGPLAFAEVRPLVEAAGYETHAVSLASTGVPFSIDPKSPSMDDDIKAIRDQVEPFVLSGREIVLVMHSAGAFLGSDAIQGLTKKARAKDGKAGGVMHIIFLSGGVVPEGYVHTLKTFAEADVRNDYISRIVSS